jgi:hypothetical protein
MNERLTYREAKEQRSEYDSHLEQLNTIIEGDSNRLLDGMPYMIEQTGRLIATFDMAGAPVSGDSHEGRARHHLVAAQQEMIAQAVEDAQKIAREANAFVAAHPNRFYLSRDDSDELISLGELVAVEAGVIAMMQGEDRLVFSDGTYHLLVDSRIV